MCVIAVVDNSNCRPTDDEVAQMWRQNSMGGGVAWQEGGRVHFKKGLLLMEMQKFFRDLPVPFIGHFRISSCGDKGLAALTHPFLIEEGSPLHIEGVTESSVLFHNGHWNWWESDSKKWLAQAAGKIKVKAGEKWSDSRAMAFWAHHFGTAIFDMSSPFGSIDEKVVILAKEGEPEFFGKGWLEHNGYIVSNDYWIRKHNEPKKVEPHLMNMNTAPAKVERKNMRWDMLKMEWVPLGDIHQVSVNTPVKEVAPPEVHPFVKARDEYQSAMVAYYTRGADGRRQGSKNAMKSANKSLMKMRRKYPDLAKSSDLADSLKVRELLEKQIGKDLSDLGGVPQTLH